MLIAYTYKLSPSRQQLLVMEQHLEMLRLQYNFRVRERTEAYERASAPVLGNYCDLSTGAQCCPLTCSVSKNALYGDPWTSSGKKRGALAQQDADLPNLKRERPWYKSIQHHVLQQMLRRVENAFQRFFKGEGGYPKPKHRGKYRSFSYPPGDVRFEGNKVRLRGLNRVIADAAWGELKQKVKAVAAKSGVLVHEITPKHTSQECSCCGHISPTNRDKEKFPCESCGWIADADIDAAVVIAARGLSELGIDIPLPVVHGKVTLKEPVARQGLSVGLLTEPENPRMEWEQQLSLFEWRGE